MNRRLRRPASRRAGAGGLPSRPVTLLVPFAAGGSNDILARLLAPVLEAKLGQPFVIENRPGGGGSLGMRMVARGRPDGSVFLVSSASNNVFHTLVSGELGHDVREALPGVSMLADVPTVAPPASDGRVRILADCTAGRVSIRPDLPIVAEQGVPDFAVRSRTGLFAPRGTPGPIIARLATAVREALAAPQVSSRLIAIGSEPLLMTPAETDAFVRQEFDRWARRARGRDPDPGLSPARTGFGPAACGCVRPGISCSRIYVFRDRSSGPLFPSGRILL